MTETAENDLAEIWAYLTIEASERTATRFVDAIKADLDRLLGFPLPGVPREQLSAGLRVIFHGRYAIYYQSNEHEVIIVRVLNGARDAAILADQGGFSAC